MNPTRSYLLHRAAALLAQLQDQGDQPMRADRRGELVIEYRDLRNALTRMHRTEVPTADNRVALADSLWMDHCRQHGVNPEHDAFHLP